MTGTVADLGRHLEETYGITVTRMTPLEPWAPDHGLILHAWGVAFRGAMPSAILRWLAAERATIKLVVERARKAFDSKDLARGRS